MSGKLKLLIGLVAALLCGWVAHGPLGQGDAFVDRLERRAKAVIINAELTQVSATFSRAPLRRGVTLSGPADEFQREGQGQFPGLNDRIRTIPGIGALSWREGPEPPGTGLPLILESALLVTIAYLIGIALGWVLFRPRRQGFL